ncbi:uncharacterized protein LOC110855905 [Folsomia candida]|uniref:uncharacterized protein LOC110855905 n=1 Tax=Folsomia candida TaxID=158441 RepID=UPI000B900615|nr:uncharacterized protein LOC110855905 [Folsomia candida]
MTSNQIYTNFCTRIIFIIVSLSLQVQPERIVNTPIVTTFGEWQEWDSCPEGTFATAMDIQTRELDTARGVKDKTGIISAVFQCSYPFTPNIAEHFIYTKVKGVTNRVFNGTTKESQLKDGLEIIHSLPLRASCDGIIVSVEVMNYEKQLALDNTGASNLRIYCSDMTEDDTAYVEGYGIYDGEWSSPVSCGARRGICGMQTLSQDLFTSMDESAVNAFRFKCCEISNPANSCQPSEEWELVQECQNPGNSTPAFTCAYVRKTGVSSLATGNHENHSARSFYNSVGFDLGSADYLMLNSLKNNFADTFSISKLSTALDWSATGLEIWVPEKSEEVTYYSVPTGKSVKIYQLVGTCSYFSVRTPIVKQVTS